MIGAGFAIGANCGDSTGGTAGNILPNGVVTESHKQGAISWKICVKSDVDPNDSFADNTVFCDAKESVDNGEKCSVGERWPTCAERT